jgi:Glycosyl hydrolases family 18
MRQSLRFLGTVAGCCTVVVCVAGCRATTSSGLAGNSPSVQSTRVPTGTLIPGQITTVPSGTPVPEQSTRTPIVTPSNSSTPIATSNSRTGVSVGFDIAFDLAAATPWNDITEDNLFAIQTTAGSSLNTTGEGLSSVNVPQWVANVHTHHRLALITIGGIADQHWEIACDDTYRSAFVTNLVNYMKSNGFDGIDLDIEDDTWSAQGPPSAAMTTCVKAITTAAHATTTASGARPLISEDVTTPWMGSWIAPFQSYVDQINLMTYGDTCANHCSTFASDIQKTYSQGIPKAKMVLGIDLIDGYPAPGDCGNIANYASQQGFAGVMVWDIHEDAVLHNGSFPCFDQLAPYVTPPGP